MKHLYTLLFISATCLAFGQTSIPIDFEADPASYTFNDFGGGVGSVIANPDASGINTSAQICQVVKFEGEVFGGTTIPLDGNIDFGDNNAFTMKVWAPRTDAPILFKLEGPAPVEVSQTPTTANAWEEMTFSFAGLTGGEYNAITIIYDLGVAGDGGPNFTLFLDDIALATAEGGVAIPIDFESTELTYAWSDFGGGVATVIPNPDASGINTSATVTSVVKFEGEVFGGSTLALGTPPDFGSNNAIKMKVWSNRVGAPVLFKFEGAAPVEVSQNTTVANEWEELTFDFTGLTGGAYTAITIIYDLGVVGDGGEDFTIYIDDIEYATIESEGLQPPITFEDPEATYSWSDFGGGVARVIDNPDASGINTSARVTEYIKFEGEVFGGSTLNLGGSLVFGENTQMEMKVWANRIGAVLLKFEGAVPIERVVNSTVTGEWETLTFDFGADATGVYTGITIIYDIGVVGEGGPDWTLYIDDIQFPGTSSTVDLNELGVNYFPNPVSDQLTVQGDELLEEVTLYNMMGQEVLRQRASFETINIDMSGLTPGAYILKVATEGKEGVAKIMKQ